MYENNIKLHDPVLLSAAIDALDIKPGGIYVDATFGRGGHSLAILRHLDERGKLIVIDRDPSAILYAKELLSEERRVSIYHANFGSLQHIVQQEQVVGKVQGILFDLGISSPQLADAGRGFSFMLSGKLDMRMNPQDGITVAEWLATVREKDLADIIYTYGEEKYARRIARAIVAHRAVTPIVDTKQLADVIVESLSGRFGPKHPATRTFMALRIFINQELAELERGMQQTLDSLDIGGRLVVISFHSLEDRIVKRFMRDNNKHNLPIDFPIKHTICPQRLKSLGRAIRPSVAEIKLNPRSRSAILRIAEKQL